MTYPVAERIHRLVKQGWTVTFEPGPADLAPGMVVRLTRAADELVVDHRQLVPDAMTTNAGMEVIAWSLDHMQRDLTKAGA